MYNLLRCHYPTWSAQLIRKLGHVYYELQHEMMYTEPELKKIHIHFYHPQPSHIFSMMNQAKYQNATPETLGALEKITKVCENFQMISSQPGSFRVALHKKSVIFNRTVLIDIMSLESTYVLHIVFKDTLFRAEIFLDGESSNEVWTSYVRHWVTKYVGYSKTIEVDRGPRLSSERWRHLLPSTGIDLFDSGIERHNALGAGGKYLDFLRRIYNKVLLEHPKVNKEDCLALATHTINNTAGFNGLSPTILVCGVFPQFLIRFSNLPEQRARVKALHSPRNEISKAVATARIRPALNWNIPTSTDSDIKIF